MVLAIEFELENLSTCGLLIIMVWSLLVSEAILCAFEGVVDWASCLPPDDDDVDDDDEDDRFLSKADSTMGAPPIE